MPFYRHECDNCGHRFRILVLPGTQAEEPTCPSCGSTSTHRLMPLVAVQFKGSGYYKTDHRGSSSRTKRASDGNGSSDTPETKPSTKSDATLSDDA